MSYLWKTPDKITQDVLDLYPELHPIVAQLLFNRGLKTQEQIDEFLNPDYGQDIHDPFLFADMDKACQRIYQAIDKQELITVYGDYDADGVSSAVILTSTIKKLGGQVEAYLPHREKEGYGPTKAAMAKLAPEWASFPTFSGLSAYGQPVKSHQELASFYSKNLDSLKRQVNV